MIRQLRQLPRLLALYLAQTLDEIFSPEKSRNLEGPIMKKAILELNEEAATRTEGKISRELGYDYHRTSYGDIERPGIAPKRDTQKIIAP
jgi:hypothetical protein